MVGPAVGGIAAAITGEPAVVFWVFGLAYAVSALVVVVSVTDLSHEEARASAGHPPVDDPAASGAEGVGGRADGAPQPSRLLNRLLVVALVLNVGAYLAGGAYEPVMVLSPFTGRFVDRRGGYLFMVVGGAGVGICGLLYPLVPSPWWMVWLGIVEGTAAALAYPSMYMLVSRAAPPGRSSTAQGLFGAAGTMGTIVASVATGYLAAADLRLPFLAMGAATLVLFSVGVAVGGRVLYVALQPHHVRQAMASAEDGG